MRILRLDDPNSRQRPLGPKSVLGRIVRAPLKLVPSNTTVPILQGPGRGLKWIIGSYNHSCWLGFYEYEKQIVLPEIVRPGDVVYDLGAHVGYFTIILAKLVGPSGHVVAFEPFDHNFEYLQRHIVLNRLTNVTAVKAGVGASTGIAHFDATQHSATGRRSELGHFSFPVYNLFEYISLHGLPIPQMIKMDIEGEEATVIPAIIEAAVTHRIGLLVSTHSDQVNANIVALLRARGYEVTPLQWTRIPAQRSIDNASLLLARI